MQRLFEFDRCFRKKDSKPNDQKRTEILASDF